MRFKLDENLGARIQVLFQESGHDVQTVRGEGLQGSSDGSLYEVCCAEQRCLVTLDLDFSDIMRFPVAATAGLVVIRIPRNPSLALLRRVIRQLLDASTNIPLEKRLWIVEPGRIRIRESNSDEY